MSLNVHSNGEVIDADETNFDNYNIQDATKVLLRNNRLRDSIGGYSGGSVSRPYSVYGNISNQINKVYNTSYTSAGAYSEETMNYPLTTSTNRIFSFWDYKLFKVIDETGISRASGDAVGSTTDTNDLIAEKVVWFNFLLTQIGTGGIYVRLSDGTNEVDIFGHDTGDDYYVTDGKICLRINTTDDLVHADIYYNLGDNNNTSDGDASVAFIHTSTEIDISTLTGGNIYLAIYKQSGTSSGSITTIRGESSSYTSTVTEALSTDDGSTYTSGDFSYEVSSATQIKAKLSGTIAAGEGIEIWNNIIYPYI